MNKTTETKTITIGSGTFLGILALIFITLKLTGFIAWSWWWVLAPLWIPTAITVLILVVALIVAAAVAGLKTGKAYERRRRP